MKKVNKLKVLTLILAVVLVMCFARTSFATTSITSISASSGNSANNAVNNISVENNTVVNEPQNNTVVNTAPANNYNNVVSTIPETGAKSSTVLMFLIGLTSISAIYTYRKVKKYNI